MITNIEQHFLKSITLSTQEKIQKQLDPKDCSYNVAIIGQTGVGKSTLINYLYGLNVAETGIGRPVTSNGFYSYHLNINDLPVTLFDSWGLEVGKERQWQEELEKEIQNRGVDRPASSWFHSIFYCINASSGRFQEADAKIIKYFLDKKYNVSVILTRADLIDEEDEISLRKVINEDVGKNVAVIAVCSEYKKTRSGESKPFGKEDVLKKAFADFFDSLIMRLPERCRYILEVNRDAFTSEAKNLVNKELGFWGLNSSDLKTEITKNGNELLKKLSFYAQDEFNKTISMYGNFATTLSEHYEFSSKDKNGNFNFEKMNFQRYTNLFAVFSPFAIFHIKSLAEQALQYDIKEIEYEIDMHINIIIEEITDTLRKAKAKITDY